MNVILYYEEREEKEVSIFIHDDSFRFLGRIPSVKLRKCYIGASVSTQVLQRKRGNGLKPSP